MYVHVRFSPLSGLLPRPCAPPRPRTALVTSGKRAGVHKEPGRGLAFIVVLHCSSSQLFNVSWLLQQCAAVWLNDCTCACACGIPDRAGYDGYTRSRLRDCTGERDFFWGRDKGPEVKILNFRLCRLSFLVTDQLSLHSNSTQKYGM